jgi:hypothetical protein
MALTSFAALASGTLSLATFTLVITGIYACKTGGDSPTGSELRSDAATVATEPTRLENMSPWFPADDNSVAYFADYAWVDQNAKRSEQPVLEIQDKLISMISGAKKTIVASWFLFDCMQPENLGAPVRDIVGEVTELLVKKATQPGMKITIILDPINRAYTGRIAPAVQRLLDAGINVFYSDLAQTPPAVRHTSHPANRLLLKLDQAHFAGKTYESIRQPVVDDYEHIQAVISDSFISPLIPALKNSDIAKIKERLKSDQPLEIGGNKLQIDGQKFTLDTIYNILLLKANHRKLLVVDSGSDLEALVASANPHNPSIPSANSALSIKGDAARYVLEVMRNDIAHSIRTAEAQSSGSYQGRYALWSGKSPSRGMQWLNETIPQQKISAAASSAGVRGRFVTENQIAKAIMAMLADVRPEDEVRIQMFYLSEPAIIDAIVTAATKTRTPVRLILDPNKDAFNQIKDGTPNRQVAHYMLQEAQKNGARLDIRWYDTHGEQNHAKVMSITGPGKNQIITGSGNWTGKNIGYNVDDPANPVRKGSPNMEANLQIFGAPRVTDRFNRLFDLFWKNDAGRNRIYTTDYATAPYNQPVDDGTKWRQGEAGGLVAW